MNDLVASSEQRLLGNLITTDFGEASQVDHCEKFWLPKNDRKVRLLPLTDLN